MKKVLSLVLVIAMVLSSMSFAFAGTFEDVTGDYEDAVNALVALGVVKGYEDGTFRPERTITRAELAKILVEALGYGKLVAGAANSFSDTQGHWAAGYASIAAGTGLVIGYPNGTFQPDKTVTYDEAYTMVLRALGYADVALKGTWPTNYKVKAIDLGLDDDVVMATAAADRGGVAQILFNALEMDIMELGEENVLTDSGRDLLDNIAKYDGNYKVDEDTLDPDHKDFGGNVIDLAPYMYQSLKVYLNDAKDVVYIKGSNSVVVEGTVKSVDKDNNKFVIEDADDDTYTIDFADAIATLPMFYNFDQVDDISINDILTSFETIKAIGMEDKENDKDNGKIDEAKELVGIVATEQTSAKLIANVYRDGRTKLDGIQLPVDGTDVDLDKVTVKGAVDAIEDIEKDDVVVAYAAEGDVKVTLVVTRDTLDGKVTRTDETGYAYIAGTKYDINTVSKLTVKLGDKGTFFFDHNGELVAFDGESVTPTDYAVVVGKDAGIIAKDGRIDAEYVVDEYPILKLATQDDEVLVYDVFIEIDEDTAELTDWATYGDDLALVTTGAAVDGEIPVNFNVAFDNTLVKYSLNKDGQIEAIEVVEPLATLTNVDTTESTFKLADGVVIFDSSDKYAVATESQLDETISGKGVYNDDGELEVIITGNVDTDEADDAVYALVEDIELAYNDAEDKVQVATVYMNGEEVELYTDDDDVLTTDGIYKLELDGDVITKATKDTVDANVTLQGVSTRNNMVKFGDKWYVVADNALMYTMDGTDVEFVDLFDLTEGDKVDYILNTDSEIAYIEVTAFAE